MTRSQEGGGRASEKERGESGKENVCSHKKLCGRLPAAEFVKSPKLEKNKMPFMRLFKPTVLATLWNSIQQ